VFDYIERFYNPGHRHSKLGYLARWSSRLALRKLHLLSTKPAAAHIGTIQRYAHLIAAPLWAGVNAVSEMLKPKLRVVRTWSRCLRAGDDSGPASQHAFPVAAACRE